MTLATFVSVTSNCQMVSKDKIEQLGLTPNEVSEQAINLLVQDFYWNPIEESSPFGNDDGSDTFHFFKEWREVHKTENPILFLDQQIKEWGYPYFDLTELDDRKIEKYLDSKGDNIDSQIPMMREQFKKMAEDAGKAFDEEQFPKIISMASKSMGGTYLVSQDNAVIALGFGQFVLEGKIDKDIAKLTKIALTRELLPILIERWDDNYRQVRVEILEQMLIDLSRMRK